MSVSQRRAAARRRAAGTHKSTFLGKRHTQETKDLISKQAIERIKRDGHPQGMKGKHHSPSTREQIKIVGTLNSAMKGRTGNQHPTGDTIWWNNGIIHKRSKVCPGLDWIEGRIFKERSKRKKHDKT